MTARTGMDDLIATVRSMTDAGTADYTISGVTFWTDDEMQRALDRHKQQIIREELSPAEAYEGAGTLVYKEYHSRYINLEEGTAVFELELATGAGSGTANYTMDYALGVATFSADQGGTAHFMSAFTYDLNAAAADVWRMKAAQVAKLFSFSTDNHKIDRSEIRQGYLEMASYYASQGAPVTVQMVRGDLP